jgi:hypothetical protein
LIPSDYPVRTAPSLIDLPWSDVVQDLPTHLPWRNSKVNILQMKAVMMNWCLNYKWMNWNHTSTQLMKFNISSRSLDRSILDYQLDLFSSPRNDWNVERVDGGAYFIDPISAGVYATLYATRLLYYDSIWMQDTGWSAVVDDIRTCRSLVLRAGYICEQHYGERLA